MIPTWQIAALLIAILALVGLEVYLTPNSYGHLFLTGQCNHQPAPAACQRRGLR